MKSQLSVILVALGVAAACSSGSGSDAGSTDAGIDSGLPDSGPADSGVPDSGPADSGMPDSGPDAGPPDAGPPDSGIPDSGPDAGPPPDAGNPWQPAVLVQPDLSLPGSETSNVLDVHIAGDGFGNAIAVWDQVSPDAGTSNNPYVIYTSSYAYDAGWTAPVRLDLPDPAAAAGNFNDTPLLPDIGFDSAGNAFAVWMQLDWSGGGDRLWLAERPAQQGWQTPVTASSLGGGITRPVLSVAASGEALIAWEVPTSGGSVQAVRRLADGGLPATPSLIEAVPVIAPRVSLSSDGQTGFVAYTTGNEVHASQSLSDGGWGVPVTVGLLTPSGFPPLVQLQIAASNDGTAFAVWASSPDGSTTRIHASRFAAGAWSSEVDLGGSVAGTSLSPSLGVDSAGNGIVAWIQWSGATEFAGTSTVYANRYAAGTGWGTAAPISGVLADTAFAYDTALSVRPDGAAVVIYSEGNPQKMAAALFAPATGWAPEHVIDTTDPTASALISSSTFVNSRNGGVCWTSPSSATAIWAHATPVSQVTAYSATLR